MSRRDKDKNLGLGSLDPKFHFVVVLDENENPNFQAVVDVNVESCFGFKNLVSPSSFPLVLKRKNLKD